MPEYVNLPYICNLIMQTDITVIVNERCIIMDGYIWIQIKAPHWYMVCLTRTRKTFGLNTGPTSLYIWATFWEWTGEQRQERCVKSKTGWEGSASSWNAPNQPLSHYPTADSIMKSTLLTGVLWLFPAGIYKEHQPLSNWPTAEIAREEYY